MQSTAPIKGKRKNRIDLVDVRLCFPPERYVHKASNTARIRMSIYRFDASFDYVIFDLFLPFSLLSDLFFSLHETIVLFMKNETFFTEIPHKMEFDRKGQNV